MDDFFFELGAFVILVATFLIRYYCVKDEVTLTELRDGQTTIRRENADIRADVQRVNGKLVEIEGRQKYIGEQIRDQHIEILKTSHFVEHTSSEEE